MDNLKYLREDLQDPLKAYTKVSFWIIEKGCTEQVRRSNEPQFRSVIRDLDTNLDGCAKIRVRSRNDEKREGIPESVVAYRWMSHHLRDRA